MASEITEKLTLGKSASKMIMLKKVGRWNDTLGILYADQMLWHDFTSEQAAWRREAVSKKEIPGTVHYKNSCHFSEPFQSCGFVWCSTCAVFLSLIKHLWQNIEPLLTEHNALLRGEFSADSHFLTPDLYKHSSLDNTWGDCWKLYPYHEKPYTNKIKK